MGGGGHHEPFIVPKYSQYSNWRNTCPELVEYEKRLAKMGLKDPWIRSYVSMFDPATSLKRTGPQQFWMLMRPGILPGLALAAAMIAFDETYMYFKKGHTSWGAHH